MNNARQSYRDDSRILFIPRKSNHTQFFTSVRPPAGSTGSIGGRKFQSNHNMQISKNLIPRPPHITSISYTASTLDTNHHLQRILDTDFSVPLIAAG